MQARFFFREAANSLVKNWVMTTAAIVTVLVSMFILGLGTILFFNFQNAFSDLKNSLRVEVFIKNTATEAQIQGLGQEIQGMPEVRDVEFVSKEDALQKLRDSLEGHQDLLEAISGNPLPPSYVITLKDPATIDDVAGRFFDNPLVDNSPGTHDGVKYAKETSDKVLSVTTIFLIGGAGFVMLLLVASILLISNTIRLSIFARRREVEIMRLVGATNWFIRWPFMMEGVITGMVGALAAVVMLLLADQFLIQNVVSKMPFFFKTGTVPMFWIVLLVIVGGTILGSGGSGLALRRFLKI